MLCLRARGSCPVVLAVDDYDCDISAFVIYLILSAIRMINALKMGEHSKKRSKMLSGGTKRKVSELSSDVLTARTSSYIAVFYTEK